TGTAGNSVKTSRPAQPYIGTPTVSSANSHEDSDIERRIPIADATLLSPRGRPLRPAALDGRQLAVNLGEGSLFVSEGRLTIGGYVRRLRTGDKHAGQDARQRSNDPNAAEHYNRGREPAARRHWVIVAVAHRRDRDDSPPQRLATRLDVGVRRLALELQHHHGGYREHDQRGQERYEDRVSPSVVQYVLQQFALALAAQQSADTGNPAQPSQSQQRCIRENAKTRYRTQQVQPTASVDEVATFGRCPLQSQAEVKQEHKADHIVVYLEELGRRFGQSGQQQRHHDDQREDRQEQDEQLVRVALRRLVIRL